MLLLVAFLAADEASANNGNSNGDGDSLHPSKVNSECVPTNETMDAYKCLVPVDTEQQRHIQQQQQQQQQQQEKTSEDPSPQELRQCLNTNRECSNWARQGECKKNPQYMLTQCRQACDSCVHLHTLGGASAHQIVTEPNQERDVLQRIYEAQMHVIRQSHRDVRVLTQCINKHDMCAQWSVQGECTSNPNFMQTECAPSCFTCDRIQ